MKASNPAVNNYCGLGVLGEVKINIGAVGVSGDNIVIGCAGEKHNQTTVTVLSHSLCMPPVQPLCMSQPSFVALDSSVALRVLSPLLP